MGNNTLFWLVNFHEQIIDLWNEILLRTIARKGAGYGILLSEGKELLKGLAMILNYVFVLLYTWW